MRGMPLWRACLSFRLNSSIEPHHEWETLMAAINLKGMDVDALLALRTDIDKRLSQKRSELEKQLSRLRAESGQAAGISRAVFGRRSALKGRKVGPRIGGPAAKPGQAAALDRDGSWPSSSRAASSTSSRSTRRWPRARAARPRKAAARKSRPAVVQLRTRNFGVCRQRKFDTLQQIDLFHRWPPSAPRA